MSIYIYRQIFFFFFFFLSLQGCISSMWKFPGEGSNQSCSCQTPPQPQQHGIRAVSVTYTKAHGNTGSRPTETDQGSNMHPHGYQSDSFPRHHNRKSSIKTFKRNMKNQAYVNHPMIQLCQQTRLGIKPKLSHCHIRGRGKGGGRKTAPLGNRKQKETFAYKRRNGGQKLTGLED